MKERKCYICDFCGRKYITKNLCQKHEEICKLLNVGGNGYYCRIDGAPKTIPCEHCPHGKTTNELSREILVNGIGAVPSEVPPTKEMLDIIQAIITQGLKARFDRGRKMINRIKLENLKKDLDEIRENKELYYKTILGVPARKAIPCPICKSIKTNVLGTAGRGQIALKCGNCLEISYIKLPLEVHNDTDII